MSEPFSLIGALDIGGTKIAAVVAGPDGPLARVTEPTIKQGPERALGDQALALLQAACVKAQVDPGELNTVGVATCGPLAPAGGMITLTTPNICGGKTARSELPNEWEAIPLEAVLRERYDTLSIEIDCIAALAAERAFGAAQGVDDCVYVTWSTGIGFGLCVDGKLLRGKHGNAGHGGHMLLDPRSDALCGCGNRGDLEGMIAGRALERRTGVATPDLFASAAAGDPEAGRLVQEAASWLGRALYNMTVILDTRLFVIGGSVWMHHGESLAPLVRRELERGMPALSSGVRVQPAALGTLTADIGALSLVMPESWIASWRTTQPWRALAG